MTIVAAANRDERHFDNPELFDISPREQKPLTFGGGIHYCVGAALARLEGKIFWRSCSLHTLIFWLILSQLASEAPSYFVAMRT